ncbi:hypothetical protein SD37_22000 [Amycolatopsis orientalis]|uniref:Uncharacterized protein n=1 Tax=Amycolatopsis orientalis TaxID=31958 RepID=A0A193C0Q7_AMYOR|nr:hypothetical protein [Amycolatopsis orientalis]ANN18057.1 hypothetical protein SD37_22000 [Amycolatopsis orientalis]
MTALPRGGRPAEALAAVEASIEECWRRFLAEYGVAAGTREETELAEMVVARARHRYGVRSRCGFELGLPSLLGGELPSTAQAQAYRAAINKLTEKECERVTSFDEVLAKHAGPPRAQ